MPNTPSQLELLRSVADGIAALFFPNVEVVIHDLATNKVTYLANNLSKRKPGDDAGLEDFELGAEAKVTGPYEKLNWDGKKMRSVSIAARDEQGKPSYLLCINLSTGTFEDARNALDMFLSVTRLQPQPQQLFKDDWQEKINTFLHEWLRRENAALGSLTREQKRSLVNDLYHEGAFKAKSAADYIANVLSMGRATVYKYLRELKQD
ncbi:helix-turn-helix transcriptional regulator [Serratia entomophila]|uniref:helix-turn-helix transcriptional regulator n=1 Tax=Serratia entomophila TaxID=42906 RepID=UPI00217B3822|nr:PAS domain-containing protein [Serratia entomophila]CAI1635525.1 Uncharacterized protein conserved in bacteria [Serratia entomophila]